MTTPSAIFPPVTGPFTIRRDTPAAFVVWFDGTIYHADSMSGGLDYTSTDAATVINNAITAMTSGGKIVIKASATAYTITTTIIVKDGIILSGEGKNAVSLTAANNLNANVVTVTGANVVIEHLTINGNQSNNTSGSGIEFVPATAKNEALILDCQVTLCKASGIRAGVTGASTYKEIRVVGCLVSNNGSHNIDFETSSNDQYVSYCTIASSSLSGIFLASTSGSNIHDNQIFQNANHGILVATSSSINIENNFVNNNNQHGIHLNSTVFNTVVEGNSINGNSFSNVGVYDGIRVTDSNTGRVLIVGNVCTDVQGTKTQRYGIALAGTTDNVDILDNSLSGNQTGALLLSGVANMIYGNRGYNGLGTVGKYSTIGNTALISNAINYTPPATAGSYRVSAFVNVRTSAAVNMSVTVAYKDAAGVARSEAMTLSQQGAATVVANMNGINARFTGDYIFQIDNSATAITLSTTGTTMTLYDLAAILENVA